MLNPNKTLSARRGESRDVRRKADAATTTTTNQILMRRLENAERALKTSQQQNQSLTTRLQDAEQDRAVLRSALPQPDDFDQAEIVKEFDLLDNSMKSWCFEIFNFALTHCGLDISDDGTSGQPLSLQQLILDEDYVPLLSAIPLWKSSGQFDQLLYYNLRFIVVQHILDRVFLPFHPSFHWSSLQPSSNSNRGRDHPAPEFLNDLAHRIQRTSVYA